MSKALFVQFSPVETGGGFAAALGLPFDVLDATADLLSDSIAATIGVAAAGYSHVIAISSMRSKDVMARVAGLLDAAMITDAIACESTTVFKRPIVAGTLIETIEALTNPIVVTFRPAGFKGTSTPESQVSWPGAGSSLARRTAASGRSGGRPDLTQAKVVVSGGRPLKDAATFESVIGAFADALGGAAGATRAAVDSGIAPNELQVGQTGKIVAPDLYIAAGISGSTQHMAGIKDSKVIVAINKDPDAPIFESADLGLVADLFEAIPAIRAAIGK